MVKSSSGCAFRCDRGSWCSTGSWSIEVLQLGFLCVFRLLLLFSSSYLPRSLLSYSTSSYHVNASRCDVHEKLSVLEHPVSQVSLIISKLKVRIMSYVMSTD